MEDVDDSICGECDSWTQAIDGSQFIETDEPLRQGPLNCTHKGSEIGREACSSCRGHVVIKVFECALHGSCTLHKQIDGQP